MSPLMKKSDYLSLLQDAVPEIFGQDLLFQQDNCPVHKARIFRKFLKESAVNVLQWPAYSTDLKIIENLKGVSSNGVSRNRE